MKSKYLNFKQNILKQTKWWRSWLGTLPVKKLNRTLQRLLPIFTFFSIFLKSASWHFKTESLTRFYLMLPRILERELNSLRFFMLQNILTSMRVGDFLPPLVFFTCANNLFSLEVTLDFFSHTWKCFIE